MTQGDHRTFDIISIGDRFNRWTIVGEKFLRAQPNGRHVTMLPCRCDCGTLTSVGAHRVVNGYSKGCLGCRAYSPTGEKEIIIDPAFGNWIAGFTDGEGSFNITRSDQRFKCMFSIKLRRDDKSILQEIQSQLDVGRIVMLAGRKTSKPQAGFQVDSKHDCVVIKNLFQKFPLRAKKSTDFKIWSAAVEYWITCRQRHDGIGLFRSADWSIMADLKEQLESSRKYKEEYE